VTKLPDGRRVRHESDRIRGATERRLAVGGFAILALCAGLFTYVFRGGTAAGVAVGFILLGAAGFALLWLLLSLMDAWARRG
jgi:hypothetical protein